MANPLSDLTPEARAELARVFGDMLPDERRRQVEGLLAHLAAQIPRARVPDALWEELLARFDDAVTSGDMDPVLEVAGRIDAVVPPAAAEPTSDLWSRDELEDLGDVPPPPAMPRVGPDGELIEG